MGEGTPQIKIVARNRKARHDYEILETYEAGVSLLGPEVKSLRLGKLNLSDSYITSDGEGLTVKNLHISPYEMASGDTLDPLRPRRLLLHKREIRKIDRQLSEKGLTAVPLSVYFKDLRVKIELAVVRGRKKYDKRDVISRREADREAKRALRRDA